MKMEVKKIKENQRLVLIGGGGHCKSVLDTALRMNIFSEIVITDAELSVGTEIMGCKVVGNDSILQELFENGIRYAFIAVGSIKSTDIRHRLFVNAKSVGFEFPNIIDVSAVISESVQLGSGIYVGKKAVVNACTQIHDMAIINTAAVIEHECTIGAFAHIAAGVTICGNAIVDEDSFVGAGTTIVQGIHIGENVVIGAGSVVLKGVKPDQTVYGLIR